MRNRKESVILVPDGGWGWVVTAAAFLNNIVLNGIGYTFGAFLPTFIEEFHASRFALTWITSIQGGTSLLIAPFGSVLGKKFGFRLVAFCGSLLGACGMFASAFASHYSHLYLTMGVIVGVGNGLTYLSGMVMVSQYFDRRRAISTGIAVTGTGLGVLTFGQLIPFLIDTYTWRGSCIILSAMLFQNLVTDCLFRSPPKVLTSPTSQPFTDKDIERHAVSLFRRSTDQNTKTYSNDSQLESMHAPVPSVIPPKVDFNIVPESSTYSVNDTVSNTFHRSSLYKRESRTQQARQSYSDYLAGSGYLVSSVIDLSDLQQPVFNRLRHLTSQSSFTSRRTATLMSTQSINNMYFSSLTTIAQVPLDEEYRPHENCINLFCNFRILHNPAILLYMLANFLALFGFSTPFSYITDKSLKMGFPPEQQKSLLSTIGAFNVAGRLIFGFVASIPGVNKNIMFIAALFGLGCCNLLCRFCIHYWSLLTYCAGFGLCAGLVCMLQTVVLCDMVKVPSNLPSALGMFMLLLSFSSFVASPLGGAVYDVTKSYDMTFTVAGSIVISASLLCIPLPFIIHRREKRLQEDAQQDEELERQEKSQLDDTLKM